MNRRHLLATAGAGGLISAGFVAYRSRGRQDFAYPVRVVVKLPEGAAAADPVVSPDGRAIVISLRTAPGNQLFLRPPDANHLIRVEGTGAAYPFWSADRRYIAFGAEGSLFKVSANGGKPKALCLARDFRGGSWGRDGVIIFSAAAATKPRPQVFSVPESGAQRGR